MRLSVLDHGHRRRSTLFMSLTSAMSRVDSPDIVRMLLYRPGFFARPLLDLTAPAMRGPSFWTAGEREYLAMSIARRHECPFCAVTHAELVRIAGQGEVTPDSARPEVLRVRDFLLSSGDDVTGLPADAVLEALRVGLVWNVVNRLANAFGFVLREGQLESGTRSLHRFGYRFPGFLLAGGERRAHEDAVADLRYSVFDAPAVTEPALRRAAGGDGPLPDEWRSYAGTVRDASYRVTDDDVARLIAAGHTEDEIFEVTVAVAVGAALRSYEAGRAGSGEHR
jgi:alkylhydroperoxidase family enzyme